MIENWSVDPYYGHCRLVVTFSEPIRCKTRVAPYNQWNDEAKHVIDWCKAHANGFHISWRQNNLYILCSNGFDQKRFIARWLQ